MANAFAKKVSQVRNVINVPSATPVKIAKSVHVTLEVRSQAMNVKSLANANQMSKVKNVTNARADISL